MITTTGIVLLNSKKEMLIGHITKQAYNKWSIIKGVVEKDEDVNKAMHREFFEETSLILHLLCKDPIIDISEQFNKKYIYNNHKKQLHGFLGILQDNIDLSFFKCQSMVAIEGLPLFPEIDAFTWIPYSDSHILHLTQQELIDDIFEFYY